MIFPTQRFAIAMFAFLGLLGTAASAQSQEPSPRSRLASEIIRYAMRRASVDPVTVGGMETSILLAQEAVALDPDNPEIWQIALDVAMLAEQDDLRDRAVENLCRLDPLHEQARLMRFNAAIDRYQTFEERTAAYQRLLSDSNIQRIGNPVASRLALDMALLYQRQGEIERFSQWLSKAIALDPSNRSAAAIATGFFRMRVQDPAAEAELMVNLMLADPTDITAQVALAQLLLEHGAFVGAERMYRLAIQSSLKDNKPPAADLVADQAVAKWAAGDDVGAVTVLERRQAAIDVEYRLFAKHQRSTLTNEELKSLSAPLDPNLATVAAAIKANRGDADADAYIQAAINAYQVVIDALIERDKRMSEAKQPRLSSDAELARYYLEKAWVAVWLGNDMEIVSKAIAAAQDYEPLSVQAQDRFEGWLAYRRGEHERALALLTPLASSNIAARLGMALALKDTGKPKEAATEFLAMNREQPGTIIGKWAGARLKEMIGRSVPMSEQAAAMERLIASISTQFDLYAEDSTRVLTLRITPTKQTYAPHETILLNVELTNNSVFPLALDRVGPIRPQLLILPTVRSADAPKLGELKPFIINLNQRLSLAPRQTLALTVNLRDYTPGDVINMLAKGGAIVRLKALLNFLLSPDVGMSPGLYGMEVDVPVIRIDGNRGGVEWIRESITMMQNLDTPGLLPRMAVLSHHIAPPPGESADEEMRKAIAEARVALAETFAKLDAASQAWLVIVMARGMGPAIEGIQPTLTIAKKSQDRLVQLTYLLAYTMGPNDPMLDAARRNDDPSLRRQAELMHADLERAAEAARRR